MESIFSICLQLAVVATAIKLLLVPTYRSTDFEVHRNWLAITHSLPISKWYVEATSEWTLDYPPFFAWFEWLLSQLARFVDPAMLEVRNLEYASAGTVLFQRLSVITTDVVLLAAAYALARGELAAPGESTAEVRPAPAPVNAPNSSSSPAKIKGQVAVAMQDGKPAAAAPELGGAVGALPTIAITSNSPLADGCGVGGSGCGSGGSLGSWRSAVVVFFLVSCNAGLLLVDHVHFQYNGVMIGVLLWSLHAARSGRHLLSGLLFAVLLNLKHLFLYAAPAYFVYLLRHHCCAGTPLGPTISSAAIADPRIAGADADRRSACSDSDSGGCSRGGRQRCPGSPGLGHVAARLVLLGCGVLAIFGASFGPFIAMGQLPRVLRRLFPFGRGLLHSYWAANAWALYAASDKLLAMALRQLALRLGIDLGKLLGLRIETSAANMAGGLVGVSRFAVLPQVSPAATALAVLVALLPCQVAMWTGDGRPGYIRRRIARAVSYSFLCGFVFGYHVHEKAVLVALLPLALDAVRSPTSARRFLVLSAAGHYGILPLLFRLQECATKMLLLLSYFVVSVAALSVLHAAGYCVQQQQAVAENAGGRGGVDRRCRRRRRPRSRRLAVLGPLSALYLAGFLAVELYVRVVHEAVPTLRQQLPFAPLMLTSVYCSVGVLVVWADMAAEWVREAAVGGARGR